MVIIIMDKQIMLIIISNTIDKCADLWHYDYGYQKGGLSMSVVKDVDILKNLQSQNTWWTSGTVDQALVPELKRNAYRKVRQVFLNDIRRFPVLSGPRRAGKSTIMFQIIDELLQSGVKPERILFFTFDEFPNDGISINEVVEIYLPL